MLSVSLRSTSKLFMEAVSVSPTCLQEKLQHLVNGFRNMEAVAPWNRSYNHLVMRKLLAAW